MLRPIKTKKGKHIFGWSDCGIVLFLFIGILLFSCKSDPKVQEEEFVAADLFTGKWELTAAYRNLKPTETMNGAYLNFNEDSLKTNMLGTEDIGLFNFSNDTLYQHQSRFGKVSYTLSNGTDTTMTLMTRLRGVNFELEFLRSEW